MANTFTNLIPNVIASMSRVLRNTGAVLNGFDMDVAAERAGLNQTIEVGYTVPGSASTITPAATVPALADKTPGNRSMLLDKYYGSRFHLTGEELRKLANGEEVKSRLIDQAIAEVIDQAGTDMVAFLNGNAGYAFGTAGSNPFASNPNAVMDVWKILADNQAPDMDRLLLLNTTSYATAGKLAQFQKLSEAPTGTDFAAGRIGMLGNMFTTYDQRLGTHTKGTANANYVTSGSSASGTSTLTLITGTGTLVAGDVVTFAADTANQYVVKSFSGGTLTLNAPLKITIPSGNALTLVANHGQNFALQRGAGIVAFRPPAESGDLAEKAGEVEYVSDPTTGLTLRLAMYPGYHAAQYEVSALYGFGLRRPEHIVKLLS
jgi:hypothetical protein